MFVRKSLSMLTGTRTCPTISKMHTPAVLILGHQKSGTTAIAALLGQATQKTDDIDPF